MTLKTQVAIACSIVLGLSGNAFAGSRTTRRVWVPPRYDLIEKEVIIPAELKTVYREVWVEPVYEWQYRKVWVPSKKRGLLLGFKKGKFRLQLNLGRKRNRGYYKTVRERICVSPGHWETVAEQILIRPQRVKVMRERVCTRKGHWKYISVRHNYPLPSFHLTLYH